MLLEKRGEVARGFDAIHTVERAVQVGSLDAVIHPAQMREALIARLADSPSWGVLPEEPAQLFKIATHGPEPIWPSSPSLLARRPTPTRNGKDHP